MPKFKVKLDHAEMAQILKAQPEIVAEIQRLALAVEANVKAHPAVIRRDIPTDVNFGTTDRTKAFVTLTHPAGLAVQAKHGVLTQAAAAAGLEVKAK